MADRIPPIQVSIESKFDAKGIRKAKKEIKNFSSAADKDVTKSEAKVKNLKEAWDIYASSLDKTNKKVKKSMDAVNASFERVEKANKRILDAETSRKKALLNVENKRLALQKKKEKADGFSGKTAREYESAAALKEITALYDSRENAIKEASKNEEALREKLAKAQNAKAKAQLASDKAAHKKNATEIEAERLAGTRSSILANFRGRGISREVGADGITKRLYSKKTGKAAGTTEDLEKIRTAEIKLQDATRKASIAFQEQAIKLNVLEQAQEALTAAQREYDAAVEAKQSLTKGVSEDEMHAALQNAKNKALEESKRLASGVTIAENNLTAAEESLAQATRNVVSAKASYNKESGKAVETVQNETENVNKYTGALGRIRAVASVVGSAVSKLRNSIKSINFTRVVAAFYSFSRVGSFLNSFIESSSEWIENLNLLEVVFNDTATSANEVKETISDLAKTFRMDINALAQYVSVFKQMANAMGQTAEVGTKMAEVLTLVAMDVSSLRNVDVDKAVSDFTGALAGQVKPVRKYGFDITMYSIDELMKEIGHGSISRTMSQQNKQLARAILLVRQSKDAWGDLAKTINTYANQQRILNDQFTQFKRLLGNVLLGSFQVEDSFEEASKTAGIMQRGIWYLNGAMIALNTVLTAIIPSAESFNGAIAAGSEDAVDALEEEEDAMNGVLAGFDKFNSLNEGKGVGDSVTSALSALLDEEYVKYMEEYEARLKNINMYAEKIAENILSFIFPEYETWKGGDETKTFEQWAEQTDSLTSKVNEIKETIFGIGQTLMWLVNPLLGMFSTTVLNFLNTENEEEKEEMLRSLIVTVQQLQEGFVELGTALFKAFSAVSPIITFIMSTIGAIAELEGGVWALVAAFAALAVAKAAFAGHYTQAGIAAAVIGAGIIAVSAFAATAKKNSNHAVFHLGAASSYADGGFQTGGLFYAGEAGPEWVGRQGNTSTIINDSQMSDIMRKSVAEGVMQANIASRQMAGTKTTNKVAVVNLDGKHLFDVVEETGRREGKVFAKSR